MVFLRQRINLYNVFMFALIFICIYTAEGWQNVWWVLGEPLRFDKIILFGQANIYHLSASFMFLILFKEKLLPGNNGGLLGKNNYLKNIFLIYFFAVVPLVYLCIYIKAITVNDLGISPITTFFVFLMTVFYTQDIFLKNKNIYQINNALTIIEVLILVRSIMTIGKYLYGYGVMATATTGDVMLGAENDFSDFYILLLTIALTRLLFNKNERSILKGLHLISIATTSFIIIFSLRRYLWVEFIITFIIIIYYNLQTKRADINKYIITASLVAALAFSATIYVGIDKIAENQYIGRLLTTLSLLNKNFESEYGSSTGHDSEISEGWKNVKNHPFLGVTTFGDELIVRDETAGWQQSSTYIHNAYLFIWLRYGLLGVILFIYIYLKSLKVGYSAFTKYKNNIGLILFTFLICQMVKNIVWATCLYYTNVTIIYIILISMVIRTEQLEKERGQSLHLN